VLAAAFLLLPPPATNAASDAERTLTILYTGSNNGAMRPCRCPGDPLGGLARRRTVFEGARAETDRLLIVDSGDLLSPFDRKEQSDAVLDAYAFLDYDAIAIGDQEFSSGYGYLRARLTRALPLLSSCMRDRATDELLMEPYLIRSLPGVKVAVFAVTDSSVFAFLRRDKWAGVALSDPSMVLRTYLPEIRARVDLVVLLAHLPSPADIELVQDVEGIDVLIGGHTERLLHEPMKVGGALIVYPGSGGKYVGRLDLYLDTQNRIVASRNRMLPMNAEVPDDPEVADVVEMYYEHARKRVLKETLER